MIPFIDLAAQQARIKPQIDSAITRVLDHGKYIMGPEVAELEDALCEFVGARHCITVSNGTDALVAALMALEVGAGDAVITTPFTFFATVEAIMQLGATPVFADINPNTFNICPDAIELAVKSVRAENKLSLKGVCPVDLFGLAADYESINQIAADHDLFVLQDAAQSFGAADRVGRRAPTHGTIGTTSFFPAKPLGCYGDGGALFTESDELAHAMRSIRVHGKGKDKYDNVRVGQNCRLDTIQAAILLEKLKIYPSEIEARQRVANRYTEQFEKLSGQFELPITLPRLDDSVSVWAQYTIQTDERDAYVARLNSAGIPALIYYRTPSHLLGACRNLKHAEGDFPNAERAARRVVSLPMHPYLSDESVDSIVSSFV